MSELMLNLNSQIQAADDQVSSSVAGEAVILNLKTGTYHSLNPVGARIWQLIQEPKTVREILDTLCTEYDVDLNVCEQDLQELLTKLEVAQLIETNDAKTV
ncbi:MAG: PqqD family protein [Geitlerinemataceae cyanobacterium]